MVGAMLAEMSAGNEGSLFFDAAQRAAVLRGLFENYYHAIHPARTVFDTSRGWTTRMDLLGRLFPDARVICCVRPIPWIIDSVERLLRRNPFELSKIFGFEQGGTVVRRPAGHARTACGAVAGSGHRAQDHPAARPVGTFRAHQHLAHAGFRHARRVRRLRAVRPPAVARNTRPAGARHVAPKE